uniref:Ssu-2 homolog n=1 Tax=Strigamia maritima TaxID=126957 RepID=T1J670_STRMM
MSTRRREDSIWAAPPLESLNLVPGYEFVTYDVSTVVPPPREHKLSTISEFRRNVSNFNAISLSLESKKLLQINEDEAIEALASHVRGHCCYGDKPLRELTLSKILCSSTFHYKLETFTEKRQIAWSFEPYNGDDLGSTSIDYPPQPWEIDVPQPSVFINHIQCTHCHGEGQIVHLSGYREHCSVCQTKGVEKCYKCSGLGYHVCKTCAGRGQIKVFIRLNVSWTNHIDDHVSEKTDLPSKLVKRVSGHLILDDQQANVCPINHFPDITVNAASEQLLRHHAEKFKDERIILQRHQVRLVPVNEVNYKWRGRPFKFYVYGHEKEVYVPDYPQTCCWGLTDCVIA